MIKLIKSKHTNNKECSFFGHKFISELILEEHIEIIHRNKAENSKYDNNDANPEVVNVSLYKECEEV